MAELWRALEQSAGSCFEGLLKRVRYATPDDGKDDIELLLSKCQVSEAFEPHQQVSQLISRAEAVIVSRCRFLSDDHDLTIHEAFLRKMGRRPVRQPRLRLFTANYDLCFETAAKRSGFVTIDGFSHTLPQQFDGTLFDVDFVRRASETESPELLRGVFHLYKLHGSIDWEREGQCVRRNPSAAKPLIIYPRYSKFEASYEPPFLEMMARFQAALRQPNTALLVLGFGFRDEHLTQPILGAVRSNVGLRVAVVSPRLEERPSLPAERLARLVEGGDSRITLVAARFEDFVPLLPDLVATTEEELHHLRTTELP